MSYLGLGFGTSYGRRLRQQKTQKKKRQIPQSVVRSPDKSADDLVEQLRQKLQDLELREDKLRSDLKDAVRVDNKPAKQAANKAIFSTNNQILALERRLKALQISSTPSPSDFTGPFGFGRGRDQGRSRFGDFGDDDTDDEGTDDEDFYVKQLLGGKDLDDAREYYYKLQTAATKLGVFDNLPKLDGTVEEQSAEEFNTWQLAATKIVDAAQKAADEALEQKIANVDIRLQGLTNNQFIRFVALDPFAYGVTEYKKALQNERDDLGADFWGAVAQQLDNFFRLLATEDDDQANALAAQTKSALLKRITAVQTAANDINLATPLYERIKTMQPETDGAWADVLQTLQGTEAPLVVKLENQIRAKTTELGSYKTRVTTAEAALDALETIGADDISVDDLERTPGLDSGTLDEQLSNWKFEVERVEGVLDTYRTLDGLRKTLEGLKTELAKYVGQNDAVVNTRPASADDANDELNSVQQKIATQQKNVAQALVKARNDRAAKREILANFENAPALDLEKRGNNETPYQTLGRIQRNNQKRADAIEAAEATAAETQFATLKSSLREKYDTAKNKAAASEVNISSEIDTLNNDLARNKNETLSAYEQRIEDVIGAINAEVNRVVAVNKQLRELGQQISKLYTELNGYGALPSGESGPAETVAAKQAYIKKLEGLLGPAAAAHAELVEQRLERIQALNDVLFNENEKIGAPDRGELTPVQYRNRLDDTIDTLDRRVKAQSESQADEVEKAKDTTNLEEAADALAQRATALQEALDENRADQRQDDESDERSDEEAANAAALDRAVDEAQSAIDKAQGATGNETDAQRAAREQREKERDENEAARAAELEELRKKTEQREIERLANSVDDQQLERELVDTIYERAIAFVQTNSKLCSAPDSDTKTSAGKAIRSIFKTTIAKGFDATNVLAVLSKANDVTAEYETTKVACSIDVQASPTGIKALFDELVKPLIEHWATSATTDAPGVGYLYWTETVVPILTDIAVDLVKGIDNLSRPPERADDDTDAKYQTKVDNQPTLFENSKKALRVLRRMVAFVLIKGLTGHEATPPDTDAYVSTQTTGKRKKSYFDDLKVFFDDETIAATLSDPTRNQLLRNAPTNFAVAPLLQMINLYTPESGRKFAQNVAGLFDFQYSEDLKSWAPAPVKFARLATDQETIKTRTVDGKPQIVLSKLADSAKSYESVIARILALPVLDALYYKEIQQFNATKLDGEDYLYAAQEIDTGFSDTIVNNFAVLPAFFPPVGGSKLRLQLDGTTNPIGFVDTERLFLDQSVYTEALETEIESRYEAKLAELLAEAKKASVKRGRVTKKTNPKQNAALQKAQNTARKNAAAYKKELETDGELAREVLDDVTTEYKTHELVVQAFVPSGRGFKRELDQIAEQAQPSIDFRDKTVVSNVDMNKTGAADYFFVAVLTQFGNLRNLFDRVSLGVRTEEDALKAMHTIIGTALFTPVVLAGTDDGPKSLFQRYGQRPGFFDNNNKKQFLVSAERMLLQSQFKLADMVPRSIKQRVKRQTLDVAIVKNKQLTNIQQVKRLLRNPDGVPEFDQVVDELGSAPLGKRTFLVPTDRAVEAVLASLAAQELTLDETNERLGNALLYHIIEEEVFFDNVQRDQSLDGVRYDTEYALPLSDGRTVPVPMNIYVAEFDKRRGGVIIINGTDLDRPARVKVSKPYLATNGVYYVVEAVADYGKAEFKLRQLFNLPDFGTAARKKIGAALLPPPIADESFGGQSPELSSPPPMQGQARVRQTGACGRRYASKPTTYSVAYEFIRFGNERNFETMAAALELVPEPRRPGEPFVYTNASGLRVEFLSDMRTQAYYTDDDRTRPEVFIDLPLDAYVIGGTFTARDPAQLRAVEQYLAENDYDRRLQYQIRADNGGMRSGASIKKSAVVTNLVGLSDSDSEEEQAPAGRQRSVNDYLASVQSMTPAQIMATAAEAENICADILTSASAEGRAQNERDFQPWRQVLEQTGVLADIEDMVRDSGAEPLHIFAPTAKALKQAKLTNKLGAHSHELVQAHVGIGRYAITPGGPRTVTPITPEELHYLMQHKQPITLDTLHPRRQITHLPLAADKLAVDERSLHMTDIQFREPPHLMRIEGAEHPVHVHFVNRVLHQDLVKPASVNKPTSLANQVRSERRANAPLYSAEYEYIDFGTTRKFDDFAGRLDMFQLFDQPGNRFAFADDAQMVVGQFNDDKTLATDVKFSSNDPNTLAFVESLLDELGISHQLQNGAPPSFFQRRSAATGSSASDKKPTNSADHWLGALDTTATELTKSRDSASYHTHIEQLDSHLSQLGGADAVLLSASSTHVRQKLKQLRNAVARNRHIDAARKSATHRAIDDLADRFPTH